MSFLATLATLASAYHGGMRYGHASQGLPEVVLPCQPLPDKLAWRAHCDGATTEALCNRYSSFCQWVGGSTIDSTQAPPVVVTTAAPVRCQDDPSWTTEQCKQKLNEFPNCIGQVWWPTEGAMEEVCAGTCNALGVKLCDGSTPVVTTAAPVVTTAAPVVTTAAPVVTTTAPVVTTAAPVVTTAAPVVPSGDLIPCVNDFMMTEESCLEKIAADPTCETKLWWPVEGELYRVCAETCHNSGARACEGGQVPTTTTSSTTTPYPATQEPSDEVLKLVMQKLESADYSDILISEQPDNSWQSSELYKSQDLIVAVRKAIETGVGPLHLFDYNDVSGKSVEQRANYALVNIAAFLAQAMQETIRYDACDENNWDWETYPDNKYRASSACGQLNQSYADYKCGNDGTGISYECEVDPDMELVATTHAKWWGAPGPLFCGPKSKMPVAPYWSGQDPPQSCPNSTHPESFDEIVSNLENNVYCKDYKGQKSGYWIVDPAKAATNSPNSRSDVEGCCWWGRGVIQTTGVCNFGKLNYFLGARAEREGRDALYGDVDFCKRPDRICSDPTHPDLKWFAGFFYYMADVQPWETAEFHYKQAVMDFVDGGFTNEATLIDSVSGIVNRGCPKADCGTGPLHAGPERKKNFLKILKGLRLM